MNLLGFTVLGKPQPQGSSRMVPTPGGPRITSDNPKLHGWRKQLGWAAKDAQRSRALGFYAQEGVPVRVEFVFYLAAPVKMPKGRRGPTTKPDIDKLCRAGCDALTGILWNDDGQVIELTARKVYAAQPRTDVTVEIL